MSLFISKGEFADLAKISPPMVTKLIQGRMHEAVEGGRIDIEHPKILKYLYDKTGDKTYLEKIADWAVENNLRSPPNYPEPPTIEVEAEIPKRKKRVEYKKDVTEDSPDDITDLSNWTLKRIIERYGSEPKFIEWLKATKEIEIIEEKRIKNAKMRSDLVSKKLVVSHIIDVFDMAHVRLMRDGAKTLTASAIAHYESGKDAQAIEELLSDVIGQFLKPVKNKISRALKEASDPSKILDEATDEEQ